jgi:DNA-binding transcriptional LysR family regulator
MENKIDSYKIFESVARNESISKASEELYISQPAVSQSIKKLEETIGGELFNRTKHGVTLTSEGKTFYEYIKKGLDFIENGEKVFSSLKYLESGTIRIGASTTITRHILMPYLKEFHKLYPNIDIEIVNHLSGTLVSMLKSGLLDLLVLSLPHENSNDLIIHPFTTVQDIFCSAPEYMDTSVEYRLEDLQNYKLICQKRPSNTRSYFDNFMKEQNISLTPSIEAVSTAIVSDFCKIGLGYAYTTREYVMDSLKNRELVELKVNVTPPPRDIGIVIYKNTHISYASNKFIDMVLEK